MNINFENACQSEHAVKARCGAMITGFVKRFEAPGTQWEGLSEARRNLFLLVFYICVPDRTKPAGIDPKT